MIRDLRLKFWLRVMDVGAELDARGFGSRVYYWALRKASDATEWQ